ncbi:MAG: hypothetical protein HYV03_04970 [Deltaproteobacteria bacterium]|nr:hypothetical protein [Deltaproteobacteria bacterium]
MAKLSSRRYFLLLGLTVFSGCSGCPRRDDVVTVAAPPLTLQDVPPPATIEPLRAQPPPASQSSTPATPPLSAGPPSLPQPLGLLATAGPPPVPPGAYVAEDLTQRLKEKMAEAYGGDLTKVPDAKVYLGTEELDSFAKFYEQRGYKTGRVTIPVSQIIQAAMRDRPELKERVNLSDYDGIVIEQVMVEGTGVSAANKYIDPDTLKVVDKLFVTVMPLK